VDTACTAGATLAATVNRLHLARERHRVPLDTVRVSTGAPPSDAGAPHDTVRLPAAVELRNANGGREGGCGMGTVVTGKDSAGGERPAALAADTRA